LAAPIIAQLPETSDAAGCLTPCAAGKATSSTRPSIIVIRSDTSEHSVIVDGYRLTGEYHVNFGWGGYCDGWYVLPTGLPEGYNVVKQAAVNIAAPPSPADTAAVFRVDDAGAVSSDASVFGSSFATGAADVAEWVCTTEAVGAGDVL
jgi:hypothetical protein